METEMMTASVGTLPQAAPDGEVTAATEHQPTAVEVNDAESSAVNTDADDGSQTSPVLPDETVYTPVYNGETVSIKATEREEITTLLQLGMKQRDLLPVYEQMTRLAHEDGASSLKQWVEAKIEAMEEKRYQQAVERYGEENGKAFYDMERAKREQRYRQLTAQAERRQQREIARRDRELELSEEFFQLQKMHPHVKRFADIPEEAMRIRHEERIALMDAYNRAMVREKQRVDGAVAKSREAAASATGSLSAAPEAVPSPLDAFRAGLRRRT